MSPPRQLQRDLAQPLPASGRPHLPAVLWRSAALLLLGGAAGIGAVFLPQLADGPSVWVLEWLPSLDVSLGLRIDGLALLFGIVILSVSAAVFAYLPGYFQGRPPAVLATLLPLFTLAMLGIAAADDVILLVMAWEATSVISWLLIAQTGTGPDAGTAARRALLVTAFGGLALLAGLLVLAQLSGTTRISEMVASADQFRGQPLATVAGFLVLVGMLTKSAQFPFSFWLPGAMAAPAPISALLHSATMVKAGVYLMLRLGPLLGVLPGLLETLVITGTITAVTAAWRAWVSDDAKALLAQTTLSALGAMTVLAGFGSAEAAQAALLLLVAHAMYKAALFLAVGQMEKGIGSRQMSRVVGLARSLPGVALVLALASASMAGLPPLIGFAAKEYAYEAAWGRFPERPHLLLGLVLANVALVGTALRLGWVVYRKPPSAARVTTKAFRTSGPLLLAIGGLLVGLLLVTPGSEVFRTATAQIGFTDAGTARPKLWHGFTPALAWSVVTVLLGALLYGRSSRVRASAPPAPRGDTAQGAPAPVFDRLLDRGLEIVRRLGARLVPQGTSRHVRLIAGGLALALALLAPWRELGAVVRLAGSDPLAWSMLPVALGGLLLVGRGRTWLTAVVGLAAVGLSAALMYLRMGGADLAATQFSVEALGGLFLILVLKDLPLRTATVSARARVGHASLALLLGLSVLAVVVASASSSVVTPTAGAQLAERSLPDGGGRNVVNVILVDARALDTMGEILVLLMAAVTVLGLVLPAARKHVRPPLVLHQTSALALPLLVMLGIFLFLRGHHEPGGGFVGGLVMAAALTVVGMGRGHLALRRMLRIDPLRLATIGALIGLASFVPGWIATGAPGAALWAPLEIPIAGKIGTPTLFDLGVLLLVIGMSTSIASRLLED